jgi:heme exporter protein A
VLNAGVSAADRPIEQAGLEAKGLACRRGAELLIAAIDWQLAPGDALLLKGANGSGKSSLLRLVAGFLQPAAGILLHAGANVFSDLPRWRSHLHLITFSNPLKLGLSVGENLRSVASLLGGDRLRQDRALDRFGLQDLVDQPARFLSSGQRRRLALARLVAVERPIWLLDEPGTGLDMRNRGRLGTTIEEHRRSGGIVLVASHGDVELDDAFVLDLGG